MAKSEKQATQEKANAPDTTVEVGTDAQKAPREQTVGDTDQPQVRSTSSEELVSVGDQPAVVNPNLDTLTVSIPVGYNEDGTTKADHFVKGKHYEVDAKLLGIRNTEGVLLLVDPNNFYNNEGGE